MEIATAVGGALLSSAFEMLFDKLASPEFRQFTSKKKVRAQLEVWEKNLLPKICAVLEDAEEKQTTSRLVEIWLRDLRDLVYDVEDVLDEFSTEVLRLQLKDKQEAVSAATCSSKDKVRKFLPSLFTAGSSVGGGVKFNYTDMGSKIKAITERLETICTETRNLDLGGIAVARGRGSSDNSTRDQRQTTSLPDSHVLGRIQEKQAILDLLFAGEQSDVAGGSGDEVCVIPIQGMGGMGKTTLAQLVYNDENVKNHFELKVWVCVSDNFHILNITKTILQSVGGGTCDGMNLDQLQVKLKNDLSGKKFFIVLDDVWNESYEDWTKLCKPFKGGALGSRILVKTRSQEVASTMSIMPPYRLGELPFGDCLSLFAQHALGATNFDEHLNLKGIGEKIVMKCKGLPLAAKTLGGLLRTKLLPNEWLNILESQIWDLPEQKNDIIPALRLSYRHLPSHLKQCFSYCAIFPKDYEFNMNELVMLWMAEGFILQPKGSKHSEEVGVAYFCELLSRSFFQLSSSESGRFVMHDLIHDLALSVAGKICFNLDAHLERSGKPSTLRNARHSSFIQHYFELSRRFEVFKEGKGLRTLLALRINTYARNLYDSISSCALNELLFNLIHLRALSLTGFEIVAVPDSVKDLKHLRYLNLSNTAIKLLPEFVSSLVNLQTLLLGGCRELEMLPRGIGNLTKLCHLDISETYKLKKLPVGIGNLIDLRFLAKFIVGVEGADGVNIRELKGLSHLKRELSIEGLQNVEDFQHAREADLKGKEGLESLVMEWDYSMDDEADEHVAAKVLELLQPHSNLKKLAIQFYCGRELSSWIGDPSFMRNMVELELYDCWKSTSLPSLGRLPVLKHLIIKGMKAVKTLDFEFFGCYSAFSALETLKFEEMLGWEQWCSSDGGAAAAREGKWKFPRLRKLVMLNCPLLDGECLISLPSLRELKLKKCMESILRCMIDLGSLTTLRIEEIQGLSCLHESLGAQLFVGLEALTIYNCKDLTSLWQSGAFIEGSSTCLSRLEVRSCPQLSFLTASTMEMCSVQIEQQQEGNVENLFLRELRHVVLEDCGDQFTEFVVNGLMMRLQGGNCVVEHLEIRSCDSLQHMGITRGGNGVGGMLKKLKIKDCKNLKSLLCNFDHGMAEKILYNTVEIEELVIKNCPSLTTDGMKLPVKRLKLTECNQFESLTEESFMLLHNINTPSSSSSTVVEEIDISSCPNLKSLPDSLHNFTNLTSMGLSSCDGLESFPERGLPIPNLKSLYISTCRNLKSLPNNLRSVTSLEILMIVECPSVESITEEGGILPPNLTILHIIDCSNMKQSMRKWGLHTLTSLRELSIGGIPVPEDDDEPAATPILLLPTTLMHLSIYNFKKLESLSSWGIQNLTSLGTLSLYGCSKFRYLPKKGLPPTLKSLETEDCPILANKCRKGKGKYWPLISLISEIKIDGILIQ